MMNVGGFLQYVTYFAVLAAIRQCILLGEFR